MFSLATASSSAIRTSSIRMVASATSRYNSTSTMHDNDPEVLEKEKWRNLTRRNDKTSSPHEYAPGWNESLASASEAAVKADKSSGSPNDMQSTTVEYMKWRRAETEGETSTTAYYSKDEVKGPLSDAAGKDDVIKDEVTIKRDKVIVDREPPDAVQKGLAQDAIMTESEEDVKADRGELP